VESLRDNIFKIRAKKSSPSLFSFVELRRIKSGVRLRPLGTSVDKIAPAPIRRIKLRQGPISCGAGPSTPSTSLGTGLLTTCALRAGSNYEAGL